MSIEGNLRDLALPEVCQLLAHTRKTGELRVKAPLSGLNASILFDSGAIIGAEIEGVAFQSHSETDQAPLDAAQSVERTTLELLCWNEGEFQFIPAAADAARVRSTVRLHTELLLMEGARRSEEWARLSDRIPNARAIPAFADMEPPQLPLLKLEPQQWEVLTGVDGQRDITALAHSIARDVLEVAEMVHVLVGAGLLKLAEPARVQRTQATPPSNVVQVDVTPADLWDPEQQGTSDVETFGDDDDEIFDPVRVGVITPEGLPRLRTPAHAVQVAPRAKVNFRKRGDEAARRGDLDEALRYWNATLAWDGGDDASQSEQFRADKEHAAEAIALASRLQRMLSVTDLVN